MNSLVKKYSTPLIIVSGLLMSISGFMLFFNISTRNIVLMHEWIGLIMLFAIIGHAFLYKRSIMNHISRKQNAILMVCILGLGGAMIQTEEQLDSPFFAIFDSIDNASLQTMSLLTSKSVDILMSDLESHGFQAQNKDSTVLQIAEKNNVKPEIIVSAIYQGR